MGQMLSVIIIQRKQYASFAGGYHSIIAIALIVVLSKARESGKEEERKGAYPVGSFPTSIKASDFASPEAGRLAVKMSLVTGYVLC